MFIYSYQFEWEELFKPKNIQPFVYAKFIKSNLVDVLNRQLADRKNVY